MRILITVHQFFPEYRAGTEVLTLSVVKELIRRGHDVRVFTGHPAKSELAEDERFDEYEYENIHIYRFHHSYSPVADQTSMIDVGYNNKLAEHYFTEVCESYQPQLVHHFHLNRLGVRIINYLADAGIAQYFTPTDFWMICPTAQLMLNNGCFCNGPDRYSGNCVKHFAQDTVNRFAANIIQIIPNVLFDKITDVTKRYKNIKYPMSHEVKAMAHRIDNTVSALNRLQGIVSPNRFMSELFIKYGVSSSIIYEKSFGIDFNEGITEAKYKRWTKDRPLQIGFIGTLAPHKGCDVAIKAVNLLPDNFASLTIFGSGDEFPDYVKELHSLAAGKGNIYFKGVFPNNKIFSVLDEFDVLVVPSVWFENTPLVIYSAQAANCPVIGSNLPGISAVITHNINGLLFEAGNYKDLYEKIKSLIDADLTSLSLGSVRPKTSCQYVDDIYDIWEAGHE
ncbi:glycosyltransferase [Enterobacter roggenkampii]|uniref:glycosyltransferase n=1 Tax=Enterobacter roggenkampii TaxID=1812935 RepID=UPI0030496920|nr:glycosyltransferase [Enterobacter roggenkampii]